MNLDQAIALLDQCGTAKSVKALMRSHGVKVPAGSEDSPLEVFFSRCDGVERARVAAGYLMVIVHDCWKRIELSQGCELYDQQWERKQNKRWKRTTVKA